jgi:hypothetical protein
MTGTHRNIAVLPPELLCLVFLSMISKGDLLAACLVCRSWCYQAITVLQQFHTTNLAYQQQRVVSDPGYSDDTTVKWLSGIIHPSDNVAARLRCLIFCLPDQLYLTRGCMRISPDEDSAFSSVMHLAKKSFSSMHSLKE